MAGTVMAGGYAGCLYSQLIEDCYRAYAALYPAWKPKGLTVLPIPVGDGFDMVTGSQIERLNHVL